MDIVIEVNKSAINTLEFLLRKMTRMGKEDLAKFKLDSSLGATSPTIMYRALKRVYGFASYFALLIKSLVVLLYILKNFYIILLILENDSIFIIEFSSKEKLFLEKMQIRC